jgi:hypothetical protein
MQKRNVPYECGDVNECVQLCRKGDPNGRLPGAAVSGLAFLGLIVATFGNGVMLSGLLPGA